MRCFCGFYPLWNIEYHLDGCSTVKKTKSWTSVGCKDGQFGRTKWLWKTSDRWPRLESLNPICFYKSRKKSWFRLRPFDIKPFKRFSWPCSFFSFSIDDVPIGHQKMTYRLFINLKIDRPPPNTRYSWVGEDLNTPREISSSKIDNLGKS